MSPILVIETCSIRDFLKFYRFDKLNENQTYARLYNFFISKIISGEIIVIDKVYYKELYQAEYKDFKKDIRPYVVNTISLIPQVQTILSKYYDETKAQRQSLTENQIDAELKKYEEKYADLYLIAYCNELKRQGKGVILVTEESFKDDKKIVHKIPTICKAENENINCQKIPDVLFEIYKQELQFNLEVNPM